MLDAAMLDRSADLLALCRAKRLRVASAESCTGGLIAALLTAISGSSDVFERGFVTYSNAAKIEAIGVDAALIDRFGAVSEEVAAAMAAGALRHSRADVAVSVTGIAGPLGGSALKPVGLVFLACALRDAQPSVVERRFGAIGRSQIRAASVAAALDLLERIIA